MYGNVVIVALLLALSVTEMFTFANRVTIKIQTQTWRKFHVAGQIAHFQNGKDKPIIQTDPLVTVNRCIFVHGVNLLLQDMILLKVQDLETHWEHSGEQGNRGWRQVGMNPMWKVENTEVKVDPYTQTNFVSSYNWAGMMQTVPLHEFIWDPSSVRIEVSSKFMGRTDCPSVFFMESIVTNSSGRVLHRVDTSELTAPADFWEKATLTIDPVNGAYEVSMIVYGKDGRFWAGNFGSKVCHCSIRVLCEEGQLEDILVAGAWENLIIRNHLPSHSMLTLGWIFCTGPQTYNVRERWKLDALIPIVFFILLAWLLSNWVHRGILECRIHKEEFIRNWKLLLLSHSRVLSKYGKVVKHKTTVLKHDEVTPPTPFSMAGKSR
jgi:hypothetical protein